MAQETRAQNTPKFIVHWTNPVIGADYEYEFETREDAERYVEGRRRKYGRFHDFREPTVVRVP